MNPPLLGYLKVAYYYQSSHNDNHVSWQELVTYFRYNSLSTCFPGINMKLDHPYPGMDPYTEQWVEVISQLNMKSADTLKLEVSARKFVAMQS